MATQELIDLWHSRPASIPKLGERLLSTIDHVCDEDLGLAYIHMCKAIELFDSAKNPQGYDGFGPYARFYVKSVMKYERKKETAQSLFVVSVHRLAVNDRAKYLADRRYAQTGEIRHEDSHVVTLPSRISIETPLTSNSSRELLLGDTLGRRDDSVLYRELRRRFTAEERRLIKEMEAGFDFGTLAKEMFEGSRDQCVVKLKVAIESLYDKVIRIYENDPRFKSLIDQVKNEKESNSLKHGSVTLSATESETRNLGTRDRMLRAAPARKYPSQLEGCPPRQDMIESLTTMSWPRMEEKYGVSQNRLLTICKMYRLEYYIAQRPAKFVHLEDRQASSDRCSRMSKSNTRVRAARIARGWSPETPPNPTMEQIAVCIDTHNWTQMEEIFQINSRAIRNLAKEYGLCKNRPRLLWTKESQRKQFDTKLQNAARTRGARIPTREEMKFDLPRLSWNQMIEKYGFCASFLQKIARKYRLKHLKSSIDECNRRRQNQEHPWPTEDELRSILTSMNLMEAAKKLHRTVPVVRKYAQQVGLEDLMFEFHRPSKQSLNAQIKKSASLADLIDHYSFGRDRLLSHCSEIGVELGNLLKERELATETVAA